MTTVEAPVGHIIGLRQRYLLPSAACSDSVNQAIFGVHDAFDFANLLVIDVSSWVAFTSGDEFRTLDQLDNRFHSFGIVLNYRERG